MKFTEEMLKKAKEAKSVEELLSLAKENSIELTEEEAKKYFNGLHAKGSLPDEELDNVTGGCGSSYDPHNDKTYATQMECSNPDCSYFSRRSGDYLNETVDCPECHQHSLRGVERYRVYPL